MIKYNPKLWFKHIFQFHKSDTLNVLWKELIAVAIFSTVLTFVELNYFAKHTVFKDLVSVYSLVGFVLSLLLVFRTNTAYDRWWEGRKKWGELINNSRNLSIKISTIVEDEESKLYFKRMIPNFSLSLKNHLRDKDSFELLDLTKEEKKALKGLSHQPNFIIINLYSAFNKLKKEGKITQEEFLSFDINLKTFSDILGACERIKNTPIPYSYSLFLKKFIFVYVTTLPLGFITTFGYYTSIIAVFIFYVLVSIEVLAEEIEDPFGSDANDIDTDGLVDKIKDNVVEIFSI
jgi:putative membrane protein